MFAGGVPLLALLAKIVRSLDGERLNLFGPWYFVCCVLQAHSMFFLMKQITDKRPYLLAFAAVVAALANAFLSRVSHVSLFGHFLCIYPLAFVIATTNDSYRPRAILWALAAFVFASMFVFAYLAIATTILFFIGVASLFNRGRLSLKSALLSTSVFVAGLLLLSYVGGYFWAIGKADPFSAAQYSRLGFNLGSLIDPNPFPKWWEGSFYVGWGVLGLWVILLLTCLEPIMRAVQSNMPIFLGLLLLALFSMSNKVHLFNYTVFVYPLPSIIDPMLGMARVGGRLFWPIGYLIMASAIAITAARFRMAGPALIAVTVAVFCFQSGLLYVTLRTIIDRPQPGPLPYDDLVSTMSRFDRLYVYPTIHCMPNIGSNEQRIAAYHEVEFASALTYLDSNSSITARRIKDCDRETNELRTPQTRELAFFMSRTALLSAYRAEPDLIYNQCRRFPMQAEDGYICSSSWSDRTALPTSFVKFSKG